MILTSLLFSQCRSFPMHRLPLNFNIVFEHWCFPSIQVLHLVFQENLSRSVNGRAFDWWSNFLEPTYHRLSSCSICRLKFFWQFLHRCLQSEQSSECLYINFHTVFHWFWPLFADLKQRQVDLAALSAFRKPFVPFKNKHEIENSHLRPLPATYSTQLQFFLIHREISHWSLARVFHHTLFLARERSSFTSNHYIINTATATKMCFCTGIVDTSCCPTLRTQSCYLIARSCIENKFKKGA